MSDLIERGAICPATGREHFEFNPGQCADCGCCFRCEQCGMPDHPYIPCEVAAEIGARCEAASRRQV